MKRYSHLAGLALFLLIPLLLHAQVAEVGIVEKRPDPAEKLTAYSTVSADFPFRQNVQNPEIAAMVGAISADTLRATLQELQDWGSRFLMNDNKREIATSIMNKFLSYGYTDVKLDSFYLIINWSGLADSSWQYNIVCTLTGSSAPDEIYVVGGHWDSICLPDPFNDAPGVDDNGTAVAATLEIARVMKQFDYHPEATIQFTLFGAEELGLFGSRDMAAKSRLAGTDVRYMLNMDMIANNPGNLQQVKVYKYIGFEWAGDMAGEAFALYSDISVVFPDNLLNSGSDSFPYWLEGFPSVFFQEIVFSPNWHKPSDTLGNCNVPYFQKVTGGVLATLAHQQWLPHPQDLRSESATDKITLKWKPTANSFVKGCNIYRSETQGSGYLKVNESPVPGPVFEDIPAMLNRQYYYVVTTVNDSLEESAFSNEVTGARFNFCDTLLVLANLKGESATPDSIRGFYEAVLDTIPYRWMDVNAVQGVNLDQLSRYRSILWMSNTMDHEPVSTDTYQAVAAFMENGGNMLYAGLYPSRFWTGVFTYPLDIPEGVLFREFFKVDNIDRKMQSMLFRANSVVPGYDTLHVDSLKYMDKSFPGQIFNIEVYHPAPEGTIVYRFDSKHDSTTSFGKMKNRPVGIEYMGEDHKSILLSFPLYYLDTTDARVFLHFIMTKKFGNPVGIDQMESGKGLTFNVYPNPAKDACNIAFNLEKPCRVRISLVLITGQTVATWLEGELQMGSHWLRFPCGAMNSGFYQVVIETGHLTAVKKLVIVR